MKNFTVYVFALFTLLLISRAAYAQNPGDVLITEFLADPVVVTDANGEWLEMVNVSSVPIDINGWRIKDNGTNNHVINYGGPFLLMPGIPTVFAVNGDINMNGGVTAQYVYSGFNLANAGDEIILTDSSGTVISMVSYNNTVAGKSLGLDPNHYNAIDQSNLSFWCLATTPFGAGDFGTPGAINTTCVLGIGDNTGSTLNSIHVSGGYLNAMITPSSKDEPWQISDMTGRVILSGTMPRNESQLTVPVSHLRNGVYFISLSSSGNSYRFIAR